METENQEPQEETATPAPQGPPMVEAARVETPVATPVPKRHALTRRVLILGSFWSVFGLFLLGILGSPLDFAWPRKGIAGASRVVRVPASDIPAPGGDPIPNAEGRFFLLNLEAGTTPNGEETPGGLLALWRKCPHLGCTVPWRPDFSFLGRTGWFRCPCHGSTYTKEGGILVAGPAPRPMDVFQIRTNDDGSVAVNDDGSIDVIVGVTVAEAGSAQNPEKTVPYEA
jgi:cytochrome b6-f complex iron-sulfur subunit